MTLQTLLIIQCQYAECRYAKCRGADTDNYFSYLWYGINYGRKQFYRKGLMINVTKFL
jgi:hypothetical protein